MIKILLMVNNQILISQIEEIGEENVRLYDKFNI